MFQGCFTVSESVVYVVLGLSTDDKDPTKYQTEEDRAIIRKLIEDYITDKRTIILYGILCRTNLLANYVPGLLWTPETILPIKKCKISLVAVETN
jgi:hypothetical protein